MYFATVIFPFMFIIKFRQVVVAVGGRCFTGRRGCVFDVFEGRINMIGNSSETEETESKLLICPCTGKRRYVRLILTLDANVDVGVF